MVAEEKDVDCLLSQMETDDDNERTGIDNTAIIEAVDLSECVNLFKLILPSRFHENVKISENQISVPLEMGVLTLKKLSKSYELSDHIELEFSFDGVWIGLDMVNEFNELIAIGRLICGRKNLIYRYTYNLSYGRSYLNICSDFKLFISEVSAVYSRAMENFLPRA